MQLGDDDRRQRYRVTGVHRNAQQEIEEVGHHGAEHGVIPGTVPIGVGPVFPQRGGAGPAHLGKGPGLFGGQQPHRQLAVPVGEQHPGHNVRAENAGVEAAKLRVVFDQVVVDLLIPQPDVQREGVGALDAAHIVAVPGIVVGGVDGILLPGQTGLQHGHVALPPHQRRNFQHPHQALDVEIGVDEGAGQDNVVVMGRAPVAQAPDAGLIAGDQLQLGMGLQIVEIPQHLAVEPVERLGVAVVLVILIGHLHNGAAPAAGAAAAV